MQFKRSFAFLLGVGLSAGVWAADPPKKEDKPKPPPPKAFIKAEDGGVSFKLQGEYAAKDAGVQVIALKDGKFRAVLHEGGLPGAGFDGKTKVEISGKLDGEKIAFDGGGYTGSADGAALSLEGARSIKAMKVERTSPTQGAAAPAGAAVLFDGSTLDAWQGGTLDDRKLLSVRGNGEPRTKAKFGDFTAHLEFILPYMPDAGGQGRGNSGVYLQNRYEVQVLDSFGLKGVHDECGGIYKNAQPKVNMCFPPLQWQTYDIDFTAARWDGDKKTANARVTIKHNGVVIHDNVEIQGSTGGGEKETSAPGALKLQDHGNPVFYRNIWIAEKK